VRQGEVGVCGDLKRGLECRFGAGWRRWRGDLGMHACGLRRRAVKEGKGTRKRGPRNSDTDARAHDEPGRRQGDPTGQRGRRTTS
jgi:hypothetical protein